MFTKASPHFGQHAFPVRQGETKVSTNEKNSKASHRWHRADGEGKDYDKGKGEAGKGGGWGEQVLP